MEYEERKTMEGNRELVKRNRNQIQILDCQAGGMLH